MEEEFKPPPFNYCDYRCDRCAETENCRVYKEEQESLLDHYLKGEDPNDMKVVLEDVHRSFEKTMKMLREMAEKEGIDLEEIKEEEASEVKPDDYLIFRIAHDYFKTAHDFIKQFKGVSIPESIERDFEDLVWYHTLIPAKVGRLVSGFEDEIDDDVQRIEEEGTLKVINASIDTSRSALKNMINDLPDQLQVLAKLNSLLVDLDVVIKTDVRKK